MAPTQRFWTREFRWEREGKSSSPPRSKSRVDDKDGRPKKSSKSRRKRKHGVASNMLETASNGYSGSEEDSDLDVERPLYAIGDYLDNRKELVANMFACLKGDTLSRMIPGMMRDFTEEELQDKCVFELNGLSRKRVRAILSAKELVSDSGTDDSEEGDLIVNPNIGHYDLEKDALGPEFLQLVRNGAGDSENGQMFRSTKPVLKASNENGRKSSPALDLLDIDVADLIDDHEDTTSEKQASLKSADVCIDTANPTDIEIVELELRRNALKSMMDNLDHEDGELPTSESEDAVDSEPEPAPARAVNGKNVSTTSGLLRSGASGRSGVDSDKELFQIHVRDEEMDEF